MFAKFPNIADREIKCSRNVQNLPIAKFSKINVRENLCLRKLMFAKYNVLKVVKRPFYFKTDVIQCSYHLKPSDQGFSPDIPLYKNIAGKLPPKISVPLNMYVRDSLLIYVDETELQFEIHVYYQGIAQWGSTTAIFQR